MNKYPVFGLNFFATHYEEAAQIIIEKSIERKSFTVANLNVHGLVEAYRNEKFRNTANNIDLVLPDGIPIVWALNRLYGLKLKERVCGIDLSLHLLKKASEKNLRVFIYGSYDDTVKKFAEMIRENYPGVDICGLHPDRFREATEVEDKEDIEKINNSRANLVFVGRGCPRQEFWVEAHKNKIHSVLMGIGGAFDIHAKKLRRAPRWMQRNGLEWLFRFFQEPRRLWKRYLVTNSFFILLVLKYYSRKVLNFY